MFVGTLLIKKYVYRSHCQLFYGICLLSFMPHRECMNIVLIFALSFTELAGQKLWLILNLSSHYVSSVSKCFGITIQASLNQRTVNFSSFIVVPMYVVYIWSNILCVGYRVVVQRSNKSEGAFVYLYCDAQKVNKNSQKGAIDLRSAQGQKTTAFTSRYND